MKKVFIFAAAVAIGFSACQKAELAVDNNLPVKQKTTANGGYSDYILSEQDAIALVKKDLQNAGGEFAKKTVAGVEPILFSDFEDSEKEFLELQQENIIKLSNPALYIVSLQDGGFALVFPDRDFGVSVIHAQTSGSASVDGLLGGKSKFYIDGLKELQSHYWLGQLEVWVLALFREKTKVPDVLNLFGGDFHDGLSLRPSTERGKPFSPIIKYGDWETIDNGVHLVAVNNIWGTGYPLDIYAATQSTNIPINGSTSTPNIVLKSIAPTVLEFLAFFEYPNSLLGINNIDWTDIKLHTASSVAPQLTYKINQYLFSPANLLSMECGGIFSNAETKRYVVNDARQQPVNIVSANHPVIIYVHNNQPALAYKEIIQRQKCTYVGYSGEFYLYQSKIHYYVSGTNGASENYDIISSELNMSYIEY